MVKRQRQNYLVLLSTSTVSNLEMAKNYAITNLVILMEGKKVKRLKILLWSFWQLLVTTPTNQR